MFNSNGHGLRGLTEREYEEAMQRAQLIAEQAQCAMQQVCESSATHWTAISGGGALAAWGLCRRGAVGWLAAAAGVGLASWGAAQRARDRAFTQNRAVAVPGRHAPLDKPDVTESELDDTLEATFPASDPPSYSQGIA